MQTLGNTNILFSLKYQDDVGISSGLNEHEEGFRFDAYIVAKFSDDST